MNPPAEIPLFSVKLGSAYLVPDQVDSAFAEWHTDNQSQRVRLQLHHDSLQANLQNFREGSGELTVHIYSHKKYSNQYPGEFVSRRALLMAKKESLYWNGPASFTDTAWSPRVKLSDAIGHEAVIALRPDDPYFLIGNPPHVVSKLTLERSFWNTSGGVQLVGQWIWECYSDCTGQANTEFFKGLPSQIGSRTWNHISITVLFEIPGNGGGWIISLEYEPGTTSWAGPPSKNCIG